MVAGDHFTSWLILAIIASASAACDLPKDPDNSWKEAHEIGLRVGVVPNPPFTMPKDSSWTGEEIELVQRFAADHSLRVVFHTGSESPLVRDLERNEIHLLVGGFRKDTEWTTLVAASRPFAPENHVILIAPGENHLLMKLDEWLLKNTP